MKLPTPSTSHIPSAAFETLGIYEPSEDSYLLLDTLSSETERSWLRSRFSNGSNTNSTLGLIHDDGATSQLSSSPSSGSINSAVKNGGKERRKAKVTPPPFVLEVGAGSGVVIAFLTAHADFILGRRDVLTLAVDVNANAVREAGRTVEGAVAERVASTAKESVAMSGDGVDVARVRESVADIEEDAAKEGKNTPATFLDAIQADLTTCIQAHTIDILVFNPPYVPTEKLPSHNIPSTSSKFETESQLLALAYAGGEDGMQITNRLLGQLDGILSGRGVAYVLFCARNKPKDVMQRLKGEKWGVVVAGESGGKGGWERLCVLRIWREKKGMGHDGS